MEKTRIVNPRTKRRLLFSICTIVNDWPKYQANRAAWKQKGFHGVDCEYLFCDNREGNRFDGFQATRMFLDSAKGHYVVIAHLDSRPLETKQTLLAILRKLDCLDSRWAVVGNAGVKQSTMRFVTLGLRMPGYPMEKTSQSFYRVDALDENLLIIKAEAQLSVSHDLKGFHLYGMDLCDIARRLGRTCYVAKMRWYHHSHGNLNKIFYSHVREVESKMIAYRRPKLWGTNCTFLCFSRSPLIRAWARARACWLLRKNEHHTLNEQKAVWDLAMSEPLIFVVYPLLWIFKKTGLEKLRNHFLERNAPHG